MMWSLKLDFNRKTFFKTGWEARTCFSDPCWHDTFILPCSYSCTFCTCPRLNI